MVRVLQIALLSLYLSSCSPLTAVMVVEVMDGTKYVKCVPMDSTGQYIIRLPNSVEGDIKTIKLSKLKTKL